MKNLKIAVETLCMLKIIFLGMLFQNKEIRQNSSSTVIAKNQITTIDTSISL